MDKQYIREYIKPVTWNFSSDLSELIVELKQLRAAHPEYDSISVAFEMCDASGVRLETDEEYKTRLLVESQQAKKIAVKKKESAGKKRERELKEYQRLKKKYG